MDSDTREGPLREDSRQPPGGLSGWARLPIGSTSDAIRLSHRIKRASNAADTNVSDME